MKRAVVVVLGMLSVCACATGFETPSIVLDLRALATVAEPPEVVMDFDPAAPPLDYPPVTLTLMAADPDAARRLDWGMTACPRTQSLRCDDPEAPSIAIGSGTVLDPEDPEAVPATGVLVMNPVLLFEAVRADDLAGFGGIGVQVELWVKPEGAPMEEAVFASKRVLYAPRVPAERVANTNPRIAELLADTVTFAAGRCADPYTVPLVVAPEQEVRLEPVEPDDVRETYVLPTFEGGTKTITENLRYSWYATAGSFDTEVTGGPIDFFGNDPVLYTDWTAPTAEQLAEIPAGRVQLWLVQRDERGGQSWVEHCFVVVP